LAGSNYYSHNSIDNLRSKDPCQVLSGTSTEGPYYCNIYFGFIDIYGYHLQEKGEVIYDILESVKATIQADALSRASIYGIVDVASIDQTFTVVNGNNLGNITYQEDGHKSGNQSSFLSSIGSLSVGEQFGLVLALIICITGVIVVVLYVNLDIQYRREKMLLSQHVSDSLRGGGDIDTLMKQRGMVLSNKPQSSPETWGPLGFIRSYSHPRRVQTLRTECSSRVGETSFDDMMLSASSTIANSSRFGLFQSYRVARRDKTNELVGAQPPFIFEFEPGFNPPLGRPEDDGDNDDNNNNNADDYTHSVDGEDDDSATYNSSIADLSNIDEQILITDRRTGRSFAGR
jgi:hypothetical protein